MTLAPDQFLAVQDLILRFWACVDETAAIEGPELFTAQGALVIETFRAEGTGELARYFTARRAQSAERQRSTRHLCTNLRALPGHELRLAATVTVFSGTGNRPMALKAPSSLADFTFDCVQTPDGWRLAQVTGELIFAGEDAPDLKRAAAAAKGAL